MVEIQNSEQELITSLRSTGRRQEKAYSELMDLYHERVYWHIRRIVHKHEDADDVLQNTFLKVFRNLSNFKGESGLFTWIYRIATNESITHLNKTKRNLAQSTDGEIPLHLVADKYFDGDRALLLLKEAIANLPEKQLLVFNMRYYEDLTYQQISDICDTSVGGLKASYHHAVKKIEEHIKKYGQE